VDQTINAFFIIYISANTPKSHLVVAVETDSCVCLRLQSYCKMFPKYTIFRHVKMNSYWGVVTFTSPLVPYLRRRLESSSNSVWFGRAAPPI